MQPRPPIQIGFFVVARLIGCIERSNDESTCEGCCRLLERLPDDRTNVVFAVSRWSRRSRQFTELDTLAVMALRGFCVLVWALMFLMALSYPPKKTETEISRLIHFPLWWSRERHHHARLENWDERVAKWSDVLLLSWISWNSFFFWV